MALLKNFFESQELKEALLDLLFEWYVEAKDAEQKHSRFPYRNPSLKDIVNGISERLRLEAGDVEKIRDDVVLALKDLVMEGLVNKSDNDRFVIANKGVHFAETKASEVRFAILEDSQTKIQGIPRIPIELDRKKKRD